MNSSDSLLNTDDDGVDGVRVGYRPPRPVYKYGHMKFNDCLCVNGDFNKSIKGGFNKSIDFNKSTGNRFLIVQLDTKSSP